MAAKESERPVDFPPTRGRPSRSARGVPGNTAATEAAAGPARGTRAPGVLEQIEVVYFGTGGDAEGFLIHALPPASAAEQMITIRMVNFIICAYEKGWNI